MTTETLSPAVGVPAEPTTPIKPSEALRLGRLWYPVQAFGSLGDGESRCAMGAIWAGGREIRSEWEEVERRCPARGRFLRCRRGGPSGGVVVHLNDWHHWSDDQIVAWLESLGL